MMHLKRALGIGLLGLQLAIPAYTLEQKVLKASDTQEETRLPPRSSTRVVDFRGTGDPLPTQPAVSWLPGTGGDKEGGHRYTNVKVTNLDTKSADLTLCFTPSTTLSTKCKAKPSIAAGSTVGYDDVITNDFSGTTGLLTFYSNANADLLQIAANIGSWITSGPLTGGKVETRLPAQRIGKDTLSAGNVGLITGTGDVNGYDQLIGLANPTSSPASVNVELHDHLNTLLGNTNVALAPRQLLTKRLVSTSGDALFPVAQQNDMQITITPLSGTIGAYNSVVDLVSGSPAVTLASNVDKASELQYMAPVGIGVKNDITINTRGLGDAPAVLLEYFRNGGTSTAVRQYATDEQFTYQDLLAGFNPVSAGSLRIRQLGVLGAKGKPFIATGRGYSTTESGTYSFSLPALNDDAVAVGLGSNDLDNSKLRHLSINGLDTGEQTDLIIGNLTYNPTTGETFTVVSTLTAYDNTGRQLGDPQFITLQSFQTLQLNDYLTKFAPNKDVRLKLSLDYSDPRLPPHVTNTKAFISAVTKDKVTGQTTYVSGYQYK